MSVVILADFFVLNLQITIWFFLYIKEPAYNDCSTQNSNYVTLNSKTLDKMKLIIDLKPKVIEHLNAIIDKFPCNNIIAEFLNRLVGNTKILRFVVNL